MNLISVVLILDLFQFIALLSGNNFGPAYGVFRLLTCNPEKIYWQPCLLFKNYAVFFVSHYCWWSFTSWSKWKDFRYRAVKDTYKTINVLFSWTDRRWPEQKRGEDYGEEGAKITLFNPTQIIPSSMMNVRTKKQSNGRFSFYLSISWLKSLIQIHHLCFQWTRLSVFPSIWHSNQ